VQVGARDQEAARSTRPVPKQRNPRLPRRRGGLRYLCDLRAGGRVCVAHG
jgi:hypothetical protein